ncbi:MAG: peptide deformylase [Clostridia bacterium]|nr:peptide deformylase [Clostridia bacterium]
MAIREIRKKGDPILGKVCKPVKNFDEKLHILLDDMKETLKIYDGVGLAAPQVGILKRVFIIDFDGEYIEAINPEIVKTEGEEILREGCLSIPDEWYDVPRPSKVTLKACDRYGNSFVKVGEGIVARAFCHESDHLDGILYIQKISEEEKIRQMRMREAEEDNN